jgi:predicted house-cleaning noncanonical NTP pyrophosphatase (MazG superfamily)
LKHHQKLVRDKVPRIIQLKGETAVYRRATDGEFPEFLGRKIVEEAKEVRLAAIDTSDLTLFGEIADLCEAVDELLALRGISYLAVVREQDRKRSERGGYRERYILNVL